MAKLERTLTGDFDDILWRLDQAVLNGSMSATLEDRSDFSIGPVQVSVRMYERYSAMGGNRVAWRGRGTGSTLPPSPPGAAKPCFSR